MERELSELSLEELWERFPIFLVAHRQQWSHCYRELEVLLRDRLSGYPVTRISHIGSTAVPHIWAKDIVDVLVEIPEDSDMERTARVLEESGFTRMSTGPGRISLNRGYTKSGFADEVFHLHLRYAGDNDELYFRDYLTEHPYTAMEYEALKLRLWKRFAHDRDAYTRGKTAFVQKWTSYAKALYAGRY